jgi:hypothetical protein
VSSQVLKEAIATLEAQALFDGPQYPVSCRVAEQDGIIYLDLANEQWDTVAISPDGWEIVSTAPVKFFRTDGMAPLLSRAWGEACGAASVHQHQE